jgi:hypothetical protein
MNSAALDPASAAVCRAHLRAASAGSEEGGADFAIFKKSA